ncbi:MAG: hypothetical protein IK115_00060 [Lachnospiraceae bacterium]|nr:hypothetical protein [Lachnospiraceae bacterium]
MDVYVFFYICWAVGSLVGTGLLFVTSGQSLLLCLSGGMIGGWVFAITLAFLYFIVKDSGRNAGSGED